MDMDDSTSRIDDASAGPLHGPRGMTHRKSLAALVALLPFAASVAVSEAAPPPSCPLAFDPSLDLADQALDGIDGLLPLADTPGRAPAPASALVSEGFVSVGEVDGVRVYRRDKRPGIELAAEGTFQAPPERVRRVLIDYPRHRTWQKHLKENKVLARGRDFLHVYQRLDLPVLDDRDFTLHVTWGAEGAVLWMRFAVANDRGPKPVPGVVRVTAHEGGWRLSSEDGGKTTRAVYRFHLDLAGSVPSWLGRGAASADMVDLFNNIRRQLPNYR
jgi:hypothetical protein